jgi:hypothetical protein
VEKGLDRAALRRIEITGVTYAFSECDKCPPGYYADHPGSSECQPCQSNTFSENWGDITLFLWIFEVPILLRIFPKVLLIAQSVQR